MLAHSPFGVTSDEVIRERAGGSGAAKLTNPINGGRRDVVKAALPPAAMRPPRARRVAKCPANPKRAKGLGFNTGAEDLRSVRVVFLPIGARHGGARCSKRCVAHHCREEVSPLVQHI